MLRKKTAIKQFPYGFGDGKKPYRLFCFHHAGGNVVIFRNWLDFSSHVEVIPFEIPGHSTRMQEACITDFDDIVEEAAMAIDKVHDDRPIYLYGHSLGAAIAFETAYVLKKKYNIEVKKLFVAGRQAPMDEEVNGYKSDMGVQKMYEELIRMGMTTEDDIHDEVFEKVFSPIIINDYRLSEDYTYNGEKLSIPIISLCGDDDTSATPEMMCRWKNVTKSEFRQYQFHGNHFFPYNENEKKVLKAVRKEIMT